MRSLGYWGIVSFALLIGSNPKYRVLAQDSQITDTEAQLDENDRMIYTEIESNDVAQIFETENQSTEGVDEVYAERNDTIDEDEGLVAHLNSLLETRGSASDVIETIVRLPSKLIVKLPYQICLARAYVQVGRSEEAEEILLMCMRDHPPSAEVARLLGSYYLQNQKYVEADLYFNLTLKMEPDNWKALAGLGKLLLVRDNDNVRARDYLLEAIRIMPDDENLRFELAMVLFHFDDHMPAKAAIEVAEKLNPQIDYKLIAKIYLHYKHLDWAAVELRKIVHVTPSSLWETLTPVPNVEAMLLLAECNEVLGLHDDAHTLYRHVLYLEPANALAHAGLGLMLLGTGSGSVAALNACGLNQDEAIGHFSAALSLEQTWDLRRVREAANFCVQEHAEVDQWSSIASEIRAKDVENSSDISVESVSRTPGSNPLFAPIRLLRSATHFFVRNLFAIVGICNQNLLEKKDFTGILGFITRCMKSTCTAPSQSKKGLTAAALSSPEELMMKAWNARSAMTEIPRIAVGSAEEFYQQYADKNQPVIITNFQDGWANKEKFTKSGLSEQFGSNFVRVSISESGRFDGPESGSLWGVDPGSEVLVRPPATTMALRDFFTLASSPNRGTKETFYVEYLALTQYLGERFLALIPMPSLLQSPTFSFEHLVTNLWIGVRPTTSPLHYDDYENLLCQISGTKELILFPPRDLPNLYYVGRPKGTLDYEFPGQFTRDSSTVTSHNVVFGSSVNVDSPDLSAHPLYAQASPVRAILNPGDVLYLPAYWHHEVQSIPDKKEGLNIAVNFWFKNVTNPIDDLNVLGISHSG